MRRCFYHTDLGQNAVFHNFVIQIALIKYSGRWKHAWAFSETVKKITNSPIRPAGSQQFWQAPNEWTIIELHFNKVKNLLCLLCLLLLFFIWWFYNDVQPSKAFDTRGILSTPASSVHERLKTNGTAIKIAREATTNNKINITRWNIYRENSSHPRRQVLKCL